MRLIFCAMLFAISARAAKPVISDEPVISGEPVMSDERVIFHTTLGDMAVAFYPEVAPKHVAQILNMVRAGVYNGAEVYRIEPGFVAQVANYDARAVPLSTDERATVHKLPPEFSSLVHRRGILSMARYDDPNSAEASFSFMLGDAPHLDGTYTIFGEVVGGMDVLKAIENLPVSTTEWRGAVIITGAVVVDAATLSQMKLEAAHSIEMPGEKSRTAFLIFAALTFAGTVAWPIVKTLFPKGAAEIRQRP